MTRSARRTRWTMQSAGAGTAAALLIMTGCSSDDSSSSSASDSSTSPSGSASASTAPNLSGEVTVFAAASLQDSFEALGEQFEQAHPEVTVTFSFGGSDALAASITGGAPADVFASASPRTMQIVTDAGDAEGTPATFARNQLEIATLPGNPENIDSLEDLTNPDLTVVLCDEAVPCGAAAQTALDEAGLELTPASYAEDVRSALNSVVLKEADAAVVYQTDVLAAGDDVEGVEFPEASEAINDYPITLLREAPNASAAEAFIELVRSAEGQQVLIDAGFLQP